MVRRSRPARLVIFGEGPERARIESLRRDLGLEADVDLAGVTDNPYAAMSRASLFVLSSRFEGLPTVLVEAACLRMPSGLDHLSQRAGRNSRERTLRRARAA